MYKLRIKIFMGIIAAALLGLAARLGYLQIIKGNEYRAKVEQAIQGDEILNAPRGQILDRNNRILATDEPCFDYCLDYRFITADPNWVARQVKAIRKQQGLGPEEAAGVYGQQAENAWRLARELAGSDQELSQTVTRIVRRVEAIRSRQSQEIREQRQGHPVVTGLDEAAAMRLQAQLSQTVGAAVRPSHKRWYPYGELACHVIGLTGQIDPNQQELLNIPAGEADWLTHQLNDYLDGDPIGIIGVEKLCENLLRPHKGFRRIDRQNGQVVQEQSPVAGGDVHLTLDVELQGELAQLFREKAVSPDGKAHNGCVVVLSAPKGEVLAMVSAPGFDLNTYRRDYAALVKDDVDFPMRNRAVSRLYEPGSTAKPMVALAALSAGTLTTETTYTCEHYLFPGVTDKYRCTGTHGPMTLIPGIQHSCNIFFYHVGENLEARRHGELSNWLRKFGLADLPGTGLPEERKGIVPDKLSAADARNVAIGQGDLNATPLHVANVMAAIARGGKFLSPILAVEGAEVRGCSHPQTPEKNCPVCGAPTWAPLRQVQRDLGISPAHLEAVQAGMRAVVNEQGGTAYSTFHEGEPLDVDVCGKSGTAQTSDQWKDLNGNGREDPDEVIRSGHMAWFAGFVPYRNPQIAFAVVVEYVNYEAEGGGAKVAGPIAKELVRLCQRHGYVRP